MMCSVFMKSARPGGSSFFFFFSFSFRLFSLVLWEDKKVRGTGDIIYICIAIVNLLWESFHRIADVHVKTPSGNAQTFNFIPT